jgi:uncharacterized protein
MKFDILCTEPDNDKVRVRKFVYDNMTSEIFDENQNLIDVTQVFEKAIKKDYSKFKKVKTVSKETPLGKSDIKLLKIQLGLSCNYGCEYCSQRFVPTEDETSSKHVDKFVKNLDLWIKEPVEWVEFWGGEPLIYIKTLKPLAEQLREKWPEVKFKIITNGSLLNKELNEWLENMGFHVGISHDGPGQAVRGPDPLEDRKTRQAILDLFYRLVDKNRISFNSMIHRENMDRKKIQEFFENLLGGQYVRIGEGGFIDAYDEGGLSNALQNRDEHLAFRRITMQQLREGEIQKFNITRQRLFEWLETFAFYRPADIIGQKCGMDNEHTIAVDLRGNVLTCQNVSAISTAPNGKPHRIGHVSKLDDVKLNTSTHWSFRKECMGCPVLQGCKGACMFLEDKLFKVSCDNAYSDHLPFFAGAFEMATGCMPFGIIAHDKSLPDDRSDLWGPLDYEVKLPETRVAYEKNLESGNTVY